MKRVAIGVFVTVLGIVVLVILRAMTLTPSTLATVAPVSPAPASTAEHLAKCLTFKTISGPQADPTEFEKMHRWMQNTWPAFFKAVKLERIAGQSLLLTWSGKNRGAAPVLFLAHQDVVPVEEQTLGDWIHPPFQGVTAPCGDRPGNCVWGRGAIDMKAALVGLMDAANRLAASGWQPERSILFAFGHDEEVGGTGAQAIARHLRTQKIRPAWLLDEGLLVTEGITPGIARPIAYIGIAEKGYVSFELLAKAKGGHSSMPPPSTAVGRLAKAVTRLEENPFPARLDELSASMFGRVAPHMSFGNRVAFANQWLLGPIILKKLTAKASTNAIVRTTQAVTMFSGSMQDNVLPQRARVVVNYRIHPRDSIQSVARHIRGTINDPSIDVRVLKGGLKSEPSPVARTDTAGYRSIQESIRAVFRDTIVAPGLFIAATDSRHYLGIVDQVYRFHPIRMGRSDRERVHGVNERVSVSNFQETVAFYGEVLRRGGSLSP